MAFIDVCDESSSSSSGSEQFTFLENNDDSLTIEMNGFRPENEEKASTGVLEDKKKSNRKYEDKKKTAVTEPKSMSPQQWTIEGVPPPPPGGLGGMGS